MSLRLSLVLLILFTLFCSSEVISTILSSSSLIHSSASDILLLIPSRVFLISVIVLFGPECLFFNSYRSLLITCIFSILFSRFLITFTIIILNSFSGSLPISFLFIYLDFCVSNLFLHLCSVFLPFHYFILTYCVWGVFFPGFKVEFFFPLGFCPPKVSPVVSVSICLFVFPLMGKAEWGGNPVCWWLGLYFCFVCCLDEASCTGCYWWLGDARSCIQVVSSVWVLTIWYSLGLVLW